MQLDNSNAIEWTLNAFDLIFLWCEIQQASAFANILGINETWAFEYRRFFSSAALAASDFRSDLDLEHLFLAVGFALLVGILDVPKRANNGTAKH